MNQHMHAALNGPNIAAGTLQRDDLIEFYYQTGYRIREITGFLALRHGIAVSERQIYRILHSRDLRRRGREDSLEDIVQGVIQEFSLRGTNVGYRIMRRRLLADQGLNVTAETVRIVLSVLDSDGVAARRRRGLRRRVYSNNGPNFAIHMDGWDKLKPYGVSVHAAVDGFSRRLLWLKACDSNKNPRYVAHCYISYVRDINGVPRLIYSDRGTENSVTRDLQYALRWNHTDTFQGLSSYRYGSSTRNTRIERFWRELRRMCGQTWIDLFQLMADEGALDTSDNVHLECVRFCFLQLINGDLMRVLRHWNEHPIRYNRNSQGPFGKPEVLYFQPELYGVTDQKVRIPEALDEIENEFCQRPSENGVCAQFEELANFIIREQRLDYPPSTLEEAVELYYEITYYVRDNVDNIA